MSARAAWRDGLRRLARAPSLLGLMWLLTILVTIGPMVAMHGLIEAHLGSSLEADAAAEAVNYDWWQEFRNASGSFGRTLRADVIGFAAPLDNASALADANAQSAAVALAAGVYIVVVWFASAGVIRRLATRWSTGARGFAESCGAFGSRLARLGIVAVAIYMIVFGAVHQFLLEDLFDLLTRNMTAEREAFAVRLALYAVFFVVLGLANLLIDLARVRLIVEDRYSAIGALVAAWHFVRTRTRLAFGIYALNIAGYAAVTAAYGILAPGAGSAGWQTWTAFALGQVYIAGRLGVKLASWGAQVTATRRTL